MSNILIYSSEVPNTTEFNNDLIYKSSVNHFENDEEILYEFEKLKVIETNLKAKNIKLGLSFSIDIKDFSNT